MNRPRTLVRCLSFVFSFAVLVCFVGCESTPKTYSGSDGLTYRKAEHIDRVWLAEGTDLTGFDTIYVEPTKAEGIKPKDDKEAERLELAIGSIPRQFIDAFEEMKLAPNIVKKDTDVKPGVKTLKLESTIIKFSRGSNSMRFAVGFGAGMPYLRIRGRLLDSADNKPLCVFEAEEDADWFGSGYTSSETLQRGATSKLARNVAAYLSKVQKHEQIKYHD